MLVRVRACHDVTDNRSPSTVALELVVLGSMALVGPARTRRSRNNIGTAVLLHIQRCCSALNGAFLVAVVGDTFIFVACVIESTSLRDCEYVWATDSLNV